MPVPHGPFSPSGLLLSYSDVPKFGGVEKIQLGLMLCQGPLRICTTHEGVVTKHLPESWKTKKQISNEILANTASCPKSPSMRTKDTKHEN